MGVLYCCTSAIERRIKDPRQDRLAMMKWTKVEVRDGRGRRAIGWSRSLGVGGKRSKVGMGMDPGPGSLLSIPICRRKGNSRRAGNLTSRTKVENGRVREKRGKR